MPLLSVMNAMIASTGEDVYTISKRGPVLLVFLRHFGCVFCRESLYDLALLQETISNKGYQMVFIHMSDKKTAESFFDLYGIKNAVHISDPSCKFYSSFGLVKGNFSQLLGLRNMTRGIEASLKKGIWPNHKWIGDGFQMPGIFNVHEGKVLNSFIHKFAGDKPDYLALIST
jgi:hypothetical protein